MSVPFVGFSQDKKADFEKKREEVKAQKVAFITGKVKLTPEEAQKFWPLYNEMDEKKIQMNREFWQLRKANKGKEGEKPNYEKINEANVNLVLKEAELQKEYYAKYKQILSAEQIYNLFKAEKDFHKQLLGQIKGKGGHSNHKKR
jgi:hypothetical protein